jgi:CheY-like chemotaxis protein
MITAHTEMLRASGNPLTGVDFLLGKPFKMQELQEALTKVLPGS